MRLVGFPLRRLRRRPSIGVSVLSLLALDRRRSAAVARAIRFHFDLRSLRSRLRRLRRSRRRSGLDRRLFGARQPRSRAGIPSPRISASELSSTGSVCVCVYPRSKAGVAIPSSSSALSFALSRFDAPDGTPASVPPQPPSPSPFSRPRPRSPSSGSPRAFRSSLPVFLSRRGLCRRRATGRAWWRGRGRSPPVCPRYQTAAVPLSTSQRAVGVPLRCSPGSDGALSRGGHEGADGGERGADAPAGLPVLGVMGGHGEADLLQHLEATTRGEERKLGGLKGYSEGRMMRPW